LNRKNRRIRLPGKISYENTGLNHRRFEEENFQAK
jgi:hypothetical protein